ncbi:MAG: TetR/AcrR family transcriptional regulator, partial [Janthinobacterium lividum]
MRYAPGHKAETRDRILSAAEIAFGIHGYDGVGVDGLAAQAGITSGAFYGHFRSKAEVFRVAAVA